MATTLELRAAAERLTDGRNRLEDWQGPTGDCADMRAAIVLARAYIAANPADDGEPVTDEWLRSLGFSRHMQPAACCHLSIKTTTLTLTRWQDKAGDGPIRWSVSGQDYSDWLPHCLWPVTRGQVRRLCAAIGIPHAQPQPQATEGEK